MNKGKGKLTQSQADEIRLLYTSTPLSQTQLAKRYNVKPGTISGIINGKRYVKAKESKS